MTDDLKTRSKLLFKLNDLAYNYPELRIGQILINSINIEGFTCPEIFYLTDSKLLDSLTDFESKLLSLNLKTKKVKDD